jgi:hypothetical protein
MKDCFRINFLQLINSNAISIHSNLESEKINIQQFAYFFYEII